MEYLRKHDLLESDFLREAVIKLSPFRARLNDIGARYGILDVESTVVTS